jgi:mannosyltransferase
MEPLLLGLPKHMAVYKTPVLLVFVVLFAIALRIYQIDRESFWLDEAFSYWVANSTVADIVHTSANEVNPPLYYLMLHYWMRFFGDSDREIRLLSAMLGALAIPVIFQIGRLLFNERFGLLAALFLAVSGFHIQYSQEARAYSLYFLLTLLSIYFTVLFSKKITPYASIGFILSAALLLYSHDTAIFAFAGVVFFYLVLAWPWKLSTVYPLFVATVVVLLIYAPYVPVYMNHAMLVKEGFWTSGLTVADILGPTKKLILFPEKISGVGPAQYGLIGLPFCILLLSLPALWDKQKKTLIAVAILFLIPVGMNLLVSITIRNIFLPRTLISGLPPLPLFWATPVLMELSRYRKIALSATACMFLISLAASIDFLRHNSKEPWRQAVEIFQKNYQQGDQLVYLFAYNEFAFRRYLPHNFDNLPVIAIPNRVSFFRRGGQDLQNKDNTVIEGLHTPRAQNQRLWLVLRGDTTNRVLADTNFGWLNANYKKLDEWKLGSPELASKMMATLTLQVFIARDRVSMIGER